MVLNFTHTHARKQVHSKSSDSLIWKSAYVDPRVVCKTFDPVIISIVAMKIARLWKEPNEVFN